MRRFKKSLAAWGVLFAIMSFWALYALLRPDQLTKVSYSLALGAVFAVLIRYTKDAFYSFREGRQGFHFLIVGVYLTFVILFWQRIWAITLDIYGRPEELVNSPVSPFISWMLMISAALVSMAPDVDNGRVANASLIRFGVALFIAGLVAGVSITTALT
ncbi:hypothetical protein RJJ65_17665 [Rhizobium hidalgonense]|uniref:Uncharacterized protein n=1 Tax=Rhizobium hidalgonense TaxID=1538159 RepID=A0AAJ2GWD9_9HYPH|nr:hypothetical protein [Rhizobium hidalgonense]MDR9774459.1 hypothetical protein [Rhizobium hidalgonense]MDR9809555.1 hypothetical protein [Rhizobium hidalgonense]